MPTELDLAIIAYVRHELIGVDNREVKDLSEKIKVSKAWVTDVRKGKQKSVGKDAQQKVADAYFGGSIDKLKEAARKFAAHNPRLVQSDVLSAESSQPDGVIFRLWIDRDLVVTLADASGNASRGKMQDFSDSMRNAVIASVHMLGYSFEQVTGTAREVLTEIRGKGHAAEDYDPPVLVEMIRTKMMGKPRSGTYPSSVSLRLPTAEPTQVPTIAPRPTTKTLPSPRPGSARGSENK